MAHIISPVVHIRKATVMVPNLFTVGNMALGFFSIVASVQNNWTGAAWAILFGHVFDILDGRVARWMGHTSRFGAEFDSFADLMTFGIAPGLLVYSLFLKNAGELGFLLAFFYVLCAAFRLARFNVKSLREEEGPNVNFTGLPVPGAGGFLAILVILFVYFEQGNQGRTWGILYNSAPIVQHVIPIIVFALSLLMISKVQYSAFKKTRIFYPKSLHTFLVMLFVVFLMYVYPQNTIFLIYVGYISWGILYSGWRVYRLGRKKFETE